MYLAKMLHLVGTQVLVTWCDPVHWDAEGFEGSWLWDISVSKYAFYLRVFGAEISISW